MRKSVQGAITWFTTRKERGTYAVRVMPDAVASLGLRVGDRVIVEHRGSTLRGHIDLICDEMIVRLYADRELIKDVGRNVRIRRVRSAA